jgi:fibronectin-binding autotransporter adhesin
VTVRFGTANGTATAGKTGDYTATSGTLTFNPGETSKTIAIAVRNDTLIETDETFFINLSRASGATIDVGRGTGTIRNDDGLTAAMFAAFGAANTPEPASKRR